MSWSPREIFEAKREWVYRVGLHEQIDQLVEGFLNIPAKGPGLKEMREALLLSQRAVAQKMGISTPAYCRLEKKEEELSLRQLKKTAQALDCELVYGLRPKSRVKPSDVIWSQIFPHLKRRSMPKLWGLAYNKLYDPQFRHQMGWSQNTQSRAAEVVRGLKAFRRKSGIAIKSLL